MKALYLYGRCWNCGKNNMRIIKDVDELEEMYICDTCHNDTVSISKIELKTDNKTKILYNQQS